MRVIVSVQWLRSSRTLSFKNVLFERGNVISIETLKRMTLSLEIGIEADP